MVQIFILKKNNEKKVAIIIPIFNRKKNIKTVYRALKSNQYKNITIIFSDGGSTDGSGEFIRKHLKDTVYLRSGHISWWAESINLGIAWAYKNNFDFFLTFNDDQLCDDQFIVELLKAAEKNNDSIISSLILYKDKKNKILSSGFNIDRKNGFPCGHYNDMHINSLSTDRVVDCVPGYSMLIPRYIISKIGLFDSVKFPQIYMELDYCLRVKFNQFNIVVSKNSHVYNDRSDKEISPYDNMSFFKKFKYIFFHLSSPLHLRQNINKIKSTAFFLKEKYISILVIHYLNYLLKVASHILFKKSTRKYLFKYINRDYFS
jgi:GT2 family glycosyltransferase